MPRTHDRVAGHAPAPACPQVRLPPSRRERVRAAPRPAPALPAPVPAASPRAVAAACGAFVACFAYAYVRYVLHKGEPLASVPLYVTNKAVAVFAVLALGAAVARPRAAWRRLARGAGLAAGGLHAAASLALLRPSYFPKLFQPGAEARLTGAGEGALLCGALALVVYLGLRLGAPVPAPRRRTAARAAHLALAVVVVHCLLLAGPAALQVARWPGGMPPMTLLGATAGLVGLAFAVRRRPSAAPGPSGPDR